MGLKSRGDKPDNNGFSTGNEKADHFLNSVPGKPADMKDIPKEIMEQAETQAQILSVLVQAYRDAAKDPNNKELTEKYFSMLKQVALSDPRLIVTLLGAGISALSFLSDDFKKGE